MSPGSTNTLRGINFQPRYRTAAAFVDLLAALQGSCLGSRRSRLYSSTVEYPTLAQTL